VGGSNTVLSIAPHNEKLSLQRNFSHMLFQQFNRIIFERDFSKKIVARRTFLVFKQICKFTKVIHAQRQKNIFD
jgi:UDP-3-O-acyl-N-acetylglucosamine deacetylase